MAKLRKSRKVYLNVGSIPTKINEIIGYLSMDFAKNKLLERDDIAQDLYVLYLDMIKKRPELVSQQPGYFFIKFKWFLLTKWRKRVKEINKEWDYKLNRMREAGQSVHKEEHETYDSKLKGEEKKKKPRLTKKRKRYGF